MKKNSKRYREILKNSIKDKKITPKDAIDLVKKNSTSKFDESIDVSLKINLKQSKGGDLSLRTVINLPNGSGKKNKVAVLCEPDKINEAKSLTKNVVLENGEPINIKMLISLIDNAKFIISNDTGPAHIASHLDKKGLVLFGSHTSAKKVSIESTNFKAISVNDLSNLDTDTVITEIKKNLY